MTRAMPEEFRSLFSTSFGVGVVHASKHGIHKVDLPDRGQVAAACKETAQIFKSSCLTEFAAELLHRYFCGERVEFTDLPVDLSGISPFRCKALHVIRTIPYGYVRSYGQIAAECDSPRASRAVGGAMASNPIPAIIPCHRVVGCNGELTGFSAPGGLMVKMTLLKMEGIEFKGLIVIKNSWL